MKHPVKTQTAPRSLRLTPTPSGFEARVEQPPGNLLLDWIRGSPAFWVFLAMSLPLFVCLGLDAAFPGATLVLATTVGLQVMGVLAVVIIGSLPSATRGLLELDGVRLAFTSTTGEVELPLAELATATPEGALLRLGTPDGRSWLVAMPENDPAAASWLAGVLTEAISRRGDTTDVPTSLRDLRERPEEAVHRGDT